MSVWEHGTAVLAGACGILIRGPSGAGKSGLALALIQRGARLVGDDRVHLSVCNGRVVATGAAVLAGRIELRGRGIIIVPWERSVIIRLIVDIVLERDMERHPDANALFDDLLGVRLPRQFAPAQPERALILIAAALADASPQYDSILRLTPV